MLGVLVHAQVDGRTERRTDKHIVFNRPSAGFLLHTTVVNFKFGFH